MFINSCEVSSAVVFSNSSLVENQSIFTSLSNSISQLIESQNFLSSISLIISQAPTSQSIFTALSFARGNFNTLTPHFSPNLFSYFFGSSAVQTINSITIQKSDLPGLTPTVSNTAESLFVGLLSVPLAGKNIVEFPGITFKYWGYGKDGNKRVDTLLIDIRKKLTITNSYELPEEVITIIDPDDY